MMPEQDPFEDYQGNDSGPMNYDDGFDGGFEGDSCGTPCRPNVNFGFALTLLKPFTLHNVALTTSTGNGVTTANLSEPNFSYDYDLAPRFWVEVIEPCGFGARATYWQLDQSADPVSATPAANGFGQVSTPVFDSIDISTRVPGQTVTANSNLEMRSFDLEGTKGTSFGCWTLMMGAGLRVASVDQTYHAETRNANGALLGSIGFDHDFSGGGPTVSFEARRMMCGNVTFFSNVAGVAAIRQFEVQPGGQRKLQPGGPVRDDSLDRRRRRLADRRDSDRRRMAPSVSAAGTMSLHARRSKDRFGKTPARPAAKWATSACSASILPSACVRAQT